MTGGGVAGGRGMIAWMVHNRVTPNLLMLFLLLGGLFMSSRIKQEVFPEFDMDVVRIRVTYHGASPEEIEQGIVLVAEEAVRGLDGVKEVVATASEGQARLDVELIEGARQQKVYQDIKQEIDRITTFPEEAEEPEVTLVSHRRQVLNIQLYGDVSEWVLREQLEQVRDRLLQSPDITQVELRGGRDYEILAEVPAATLRVHGLTLERIAARIAAASVELPGGTLETAAGDVLLRVKERRDWAREFARIPIVTTADGTQLLLEDIARVREGFEDTDRGATYNRRRSMELAVYRVGAQTPIGVADATRQILADLTPDLPPGIAWHIGNDRSDIFRQRLELLLKNAGMGLLLVLGVLGLFLEFKLAFWVTMGIPTAFLGGLLFLPGLAVSISMISMFAFIIALGIVVDDAIVAGENIYDYRSEGMDPARAAILGARDVATPIAFSILTNVVAFLPLCFVPGTIGKIWRVIPLVVITVFLVSWLEALLILPAHLGHVRSRPFSRATARLHGLQQAFSRRVKVFIAQSYGPFLDGCLRRRGLTLATGLGLLMVVLGYVDSGRIGMILMPRVEADMAVATAVLPVGSPRARVEEARDHLVAAIDRVAKGHGGKGLVEGVFALIDENEVEVSAQLTEAWQRSLHTSQVTRLWREATGSIAGLESLRFQADRGGPGAGASLTVQLSHRDISVLDRAGADLAGRLAAFGNVKDIDDGYTPGKQQLDFHITAEGESLGLSAAEIARQVRHAFYGAEALRQQRGRNEVKVRVRRPRAERISEQDVESLMVRTPAGPFVPLRQVARIERGRAYTVITRRDGRRTINVTADVEPVGETSLVQATLDRTLLPDLARRYPGLSYGYEGKQADLQESLQSLQTGFLLALLIMYFLLAVPFRSYSQPLIVMVAIPFGVVGAVLGHLIMGYNLSLMSMMGMIALAGVVVNDSLVLIDYANGRRRGGDTSLEAIRTAGRRRFRPILLTTLTTFGGLAPMIFETSRQARFLIPMALSLGFGILFATGITLVLVPCLYLLAEDGKSACRRWFFRADT
jgi:multidrug efflux pump subunit AcrB